MTGREWDSYFKSLTPQYLKGLRDALGTLEQDNVFNDQFKDSGLFLLKTYIRCVLLEKGEETGLQRVS